MTELEIVELQIVELLIVELQIVVEPVRNGCDGIAKEDPVGPVGDVPDVRRG